LLWINLVTDVFPELALAVEPPEGNVLERTPDDPRRALVAPADYRRIGIDAGIMTAATFGSFLYGVGRHGVGPMASSLAFNTLLTAQLLHSISSRSEKTSIFDRASLSPNRFIHYAVGGGLSLQLAAELVAGLRTTLGTQRLPIRDILVGMSLAGGSFLVIESIKAARLAAREDAPMMSSRIGLTRLALPVRAEESDA
jgi:Ca2+-transporting ATPase